MAQAFRAGSGWSGLGVILALAWVATASSGQDGAPGEPVALDKLLKLPSSIEYDVQTRGGLTPGEWRARFTSLQVELEGQKRTLSDAEKKMAEVASGQEAWQIGPSLPGVASSPSEGPLDYSLRQEINRARAEIERIERKLQDLEIEANLAGVPPEWRT